MVSWWPDADWMDLPTSAGGHWGPLGCNCWVVGGSDLHALIPFGSLCGRSSVGAEMANENHGSPREEASLLSHSPGTSNQSQPSSPKPIRLAQDLPGTGKGQWQGGGSEGAPGGALTQAGFHACLQRSWCMRAGRSAGAGGRTGPTTLTDSPTSLYGRCPCWASMMLL